jgi:hypothetical protein
MKHLSRLAATSIIVLTGTMFAQTQPKTVPDRPNPGEIPLPVIHTSINPMPGVDQLPSHTAMPDVLVMNNGQPVKTTGTRYSLLQTNFFLASPSVVASMSFHQNY